MFLVPVENLLMAIIRDPAKLNSEWPNETCFHPFQLRFETMANTRVYILVLTGGDSSWGWTAVARAVELKKILFLMWMRRIVKVERMVNETSGGKVLILAARMKTICLSNRVVRASPRVPLEIPYLSGWRRLMDH